MNRVISLAVQMHNSARAAKIASTHDGNVLLSRMLITPSDGNNRDVFTWMADKTQEESSRRQGC